MDAPAAALALAAAATVMLLAGVVLTRAADRIAAGSRYGRGWVGFLLLSAVTSLPEAVTGLSSITAYHLPNIAVGDIVGSLQFNLFVLALGVIILRPTIPRGVAWHRLTTLVLVGLTGALLAFFMLARTSGVIAGIALATPLLMLAHPALGRFLLRRTIGETSGATPADHRVWLRFALSAAAVVMAGLVLPPAARDLADATGWGRTLVGTLLVGASTSLPELVVTMTALRIGAVDLALSDILGSNVFDMFLLGLYDLADGRPALLAALEPLHAWSMAAAVVLHVVAWGAMRPSRHARAFMMPGAWVLAAGYLAAQGVLMWRAV